MPYIHAGTPRGRVAAGLAVLALSAAVLGPHAALAGPPIRPVLPTTATTTHPFTLTELHPGGTEVTALVVSDEPTTFTATINQAPDSGQPAAPGDTIAGVVNQAPTVAVATTGGTAPAADYATSHPIHVTGLQPNTTYDLDAAGATRTGEHFSAHARFTTLKQRLRVTLQQIKITSDGDLGGKGEPTWYWQVFSAGGTVQDCFPQSAGHCKKGSYGEGTVTPRTASGAPFSFVFAQENYQTVLNPNPAPGDEDFATMPEQLQLDVAATESDGIVSTIVDHLTIVFIPGGPSSAVWHAPQGAEHASQTVTLTANSGRFASTMTFTFELFYDNQSYPANVGHVFSSSK